MLKQLPIESGQTVLDLGCGPGLVSARLATRCASVIGIDREADFLEAARRHCPAKCGFVEADLAELDSLELRPANGMWSSFTAAYFPAFEPVLASWAACVKPGGWLAIVEIDDLLAGHHPLPVEIQRAFKEFTEHMRLNGLYDFRMGRRLGKMCRALGLTVVSETALEDRELAFDGEASPEILAAWKRRFERMSSMRAYFGARRFNEISQEFLETISSPAHYSTASVVMVLAMRPE